MPDIVLHIEILHKKKKSIYKIIVNQLSNGGVLERLLRFYDNLDRFLHQDKVVIIN